MQPAEELLAEGASPEAAPAAASEAPVGSVSQDLDSVTAVGVISVDGVCPAESEMTKLYMDTEDGPTGHDFNEISWDSQTGSSWRDPYVSYDYDDAAIVNYGFGLTICKVNGKIFKPHTTDVSQTGRYYGVLRMSESCPANGLKASRYVDTEDDDNANRVEGSLSPSSWNKYGFNLQFCVFTSGPSSNVEHGFPDIGVSYAVFHDYDDVAIGDNQYKILKKRYFMTNDEDDGNNNSISGETTAAKDALKRMVFPWGTNTYFEMGKVR
jgi:hypothetical protein